MSRIRAWLEEQGLGKHAELFEANDLDTDVLAELEEADLKDLGLSLGDRKRVMAALRAWKQPEAAAPPPSQVAARRQVTVLFADLTGFTSLSNRLDAEELHALLQRFFAEVDEAVRSFGGSIDKHIGDAVMAVFGAPVAHSDDPERAVRCALEIHARLAVFHPPQQSHIGIASGQVVASQTGSSAFTEYTVTGASVNLAARLQDLAQAGETLVSEEVKRAAGRILEAEPAGALTVKGIERPVNAWRVTGLAAGPAEERPFVGRERESAQLENLLRVCREERLGQVAVLRGDPGIGKTRLGDHLGALAESAGFQTHKALVLDFGAAKGREALPALLRSLLGLAPGSAAETRSKAIAGALEQGLAVAEDRVHLFSLLDLPLPAELVGLAQAMQAETRTRGQARALSRLIVARAAESPLFLRVEDLHWAEPELLDQLARIAADSAAAPVFLLFSTRIQGDPLDAAWRSLLDTTPITTLDLGPLAQAAALALARSYKVAEESFTKDCIERAAGNPLFLDQLLQMVGESVQNGIPGSVQSIVQSRMDRLQPAERAALEAASVLGQRFAGEALAGLLDRDPAAVSRPLLAQGLIKPEGDGFLFAHALVRDGVYATLLQDRRRDLHGRAAVFFREREPALHARHLRGAEDPAAAAAFLEAARESAREHRLEAARRLIDEGLALPKTRELHFALTVEKSEILRNLGDSEASLLCYAEAMALAEAARERAVCHLGQAAAMRILDRFEAAFEELEKAEALIDPLADGVLLAELWSLRGNLLFPLGRPDDCLAAHTRALALARKVGAAEAEVRALGGLGDANYAKGRLAEARQHFADCVEKARAQGLGQIEVVNAPMLAWSSLMVGDYVSGVAEAGTAYDQATAAGNDRAAIIALNGLATSSIDRADFDKAQFYCTQIVRLSDRLQSGRFRSYGLNMLSEVAFLRDDPDEARRLSDLAWAEAQASAISFCGPWIMGMRARLHRDPSLARQDLEHGAEILAAGSVAHNHFFYYRHALEFAVEKRDWAEVERQATAFERYLGAYETPWSDFYLSRARLLSALDQGEEGAALEAERERLQAIAGREGLAIWARALAA